MRITATIAACLLAATPAAAQTVTLNEVVHLQAVRDECIGIGMDEAAVSRAMRRSGLVEADLDRSRDPRLDQWSKASVQQIQKDPKVCENALAKYGPAGWLRRRDPRTYPEDVRAAQTRIQQFDELKDIERRCKEYTIDQGAVDTLLRDYGLTRQNAYEFATDETVRDISQSRNAFANDPVSHCKWAWDEWGQETRAPRFRVLSRR